MVTLPTVVTARCPDCNSPVSDETSYFGVHTASCTLVMCQCEHVDHEHPATSHPYLGVRAGTHRAQHVRPGLRRVRRRTPRRPPAR